MHEACFYFFLPRVTKIPRARHQCLQDQEYLQQYQIDKLVGEMFARLVKARPNDPVGFLIKELQVMRDAELQARHLSVASVPSSVQV